MPPNFSTLAWAASSAAEAPRMKTETPGPESRAPHDRMARQGVFGGVVRLRPVAFESGLGVTLTDVDGNIYLDFTSGIAWSTYGHILRMAPPIVISKEHLAQDLDIVEESIAVAEEQCGA